MGKKIFIAGGAGFIGSHIADFYLNKGCQVAVMDNLSTGRVSNIQHHLNHANFKFFEEDIITSSQLKDVLSQSDIVFSMAAKVGVFNVIENPMETLTNNVRVLERMLDILAGFEHKPLLLIASTSEVYGSDKEAMKEEHPIIIDSTAKSHASYPVSKLYNEVNGLAYHKDKDIPTIIVRIFNTTGPRQRSHYGMVVPRFIKQAMNHEPITVFGDGLQTRSFCLVTHLCEQLDGLCNNPDSIGKIINVGNRQDISIIDLANLVKEVTKSSSEVVYYSLKKAYGGGDLEIRHRKPDLQLVEKLTGMTCSWDIAEIVEEVVKAYKLMETDTAEY